ncbi:YjgN family protein [Methylobacterium pseudosasicola]|uniref:Uncharacterized membrane protein YjgN, DUF898 family n=1 Tax=Methylobacterium pseudosasicola TaxID=582667 RepID=A0A1I4HC12_9HYPH|nr:DUF898 family protein [Methylobacterium pseudosasicola]SFL39223.1 Uncharacterized membrane protein YjgN, DUF898 family [Methylobacterium pseudosasicola]
MDVRNTVSAERPERGGEIAFDQSLAGLAGIVVKGFLLSLATSGIYRFWYATNLRRFFWSRTLVDGSPAAYTGRGEDLFVGFLVAIVVLAPIFAGLSALSLLLPDSPVIAYGLGFVALFLLGQFALYRGRRYRASRTLWRGIRLGQDGSGLVYAVLAAGWWIVVLATFGLAFPFMRAALERYRIRHTLVGTSRMESRARGLAVLPSWLLIWAVVVGTVVALTILAMLGIHARGSRLGEVVLPILTILVTLPVPALYPFYRARETRAFLSAIRLGEVRLVSQMKAWDLYRPYLAYLVQCLKLGILITVAAAIVVVIMMVSGDAVAHSVRFAIGAVIVVALYAWYLVSSVVLYVRVLKAGLWRAVAETTRISDVAALAAIVASAGGMSSSLGEGMADALDVGGVLDIGF